MKLGGTSQCWGAHGSLEWPRDTEDGDPPSKTLRWERAGQQLPGALLCSWLNSDSRETGKHPKCLHADTAEPWPQNAA